MIRDWTGILDRLLEFRRERDREQFHSVKNLACSISIEAGELLELFQWLEGDEAESFARGEGGERTEDEVADIALYLMLLCSDLNIDLEDAMLRKIGKNVRKYPAGRARGSAKKYSEIKNDEPS